MVIRQARNGCLLVLLVIGLGLVSSSACGDGNGNDNALTIEEYFERLDGLDQNLTRDSADLDEEFQALSDAETLEKASDYYHDQLRIIAEFVDGLSALEPLAPAMQAHEEAVAGAEMIEGAFTDFVAKVDSARPFESYAEFDATVKAFAQELDLSSAFDPYNAACAKLETTAIDAQITLDLDCD